MMANRKKKSFFNRLYTLTYFISLIPVRVYDSLHGTEFSGIDMSDEKEGRFSYFPSSVFSFPFLKRYIQRRLQCGRGHSVLDIGCGKGLVLHFFSQFCFDRVSGIEYDKKLSRLAGRNLRKVSGTARVYEADAVSFPLYRDYDVFYLYNPFNERVLEKCLDRILSTLESAPRTLTVFYCNPVYGEVLKKKGFREEGHFYYKTVVFVLHGDKRNEEPF